MFRVVQYHMELGMMLSISPMGTTVKMSIRKYFFKYFLHECNEDDYNGEFVVRF